MWKFLQDNPFVLGACTGSLAAFLIGLVVNWFKRERKWLGFSVTSRNIVSKGHKRLSIRFDDQNIERLDSHTVIVRNIGNKPLKDLPVIIKCGLGGEVLEVDVTAPDGAVFRDEQNDQNEIVVYCDLLNPDELAEVGLTIANAPNEEIFVTARSEGLTVKRISAQAPIAELIELVGSSSAGSLGTLFLSVTAKAFQRWR